MFTTHRVCHVKWQLQIRDRCIISPKQFVNRAAFRRAQAQNKRPDLG